MNRNWRLRCKYFKTGSKEAIVPEDANSSKKDEDLGLVLALITKRYLSRRLTLGHIDIRDSLPFDLGGSFKGGRTSSPFSNSDIVSGQLLSSLLGSIP